MDKLPDNEKIQLGHEALESFIEQFKPLTNHSVILLEIIFELLMTGRLEK